MLTEPPADDQGWATGGYARTAEPLPADGQQAGLVAWETGDLEERRLRPGGSADPVGC